MTAPQSTFITVLAWLMIIFSGFATLVGVLQSVIVAIAMPITPLTDADAASMPYAMRLLFDNFHLFVFANTAISIIALGAAIGLLKRREWARRTVIGLFVLGAVAVAASAIMQQVMAQWMVSGDSTMPSDAATMMLAMRIGAGIFATVFLAAFGWIAVKLNSPSTRAEFQP